MTTAFMVFLTIYTLGLRIDMFTTGFDLLQEKFGFLYWYGIQVAGCGVIGLIMVAVARKTLKKLDIALLAVLLAWLALSAVMNRDLGFKENLSGVLTIGVTVVAFYLVGRFFSKENLYFCLTRVILWGTVVWNYGCLISLGEYISNYKGYYQFGGFFRRSRQGLMDGRLFGCFSDPNYAALISLLLIGGLVFIYRYHNRVYGAVGAGAVSGAGARGAAGDGAVHGAAGDGSAAGARRPVWLSLERIYILLSIVMYALYFILSGSRSGDIALLATVVVMIVVVTYRKRNHVDGAAGVAGAEAAGGSAAGAEAGAAGGADAAQGEQIEGAFQRLIDRMAPIKSGVVRAYGVRIVMALVVLVVVYFGVIFGLQTLGKLAVPDRDIENELERDDVTADNISNSRFRIWGDYVDLVMDRPIFGLSTRGALPYAKKLDPESYLSDRQYNQHSLFIQMLVQGGVVGFLLMMVFLLRAL
ncbi:MAG: O-antigen ligase family protein, partial [Eubacterium sp.]|nr:O-antigen ligase family protein [Eubacterium sp.]